MKRILIVLVTLFLLCAVQCFAEIEIKAEVDKRKLSTDEELVYKVIISSSGESLANPEFPEFEDFFLVSQANTSDIIIKGVQTKAAVIYVFILTPKSAGKFVIGPVQLKTKTATYKSDPIEIEVTPGKGGSLPRQIPVQPPENPRQENPSAKEGITL